MPLKSGFTGNSEAAALLRYPTQVASSVFVDICKERLRQLNDVHGLSNRCRAVRGRAWICAAHYQAEYASQHTDMRAGGAVNAGPVEPYQATGGEQAGAAGHPSTKRSGGGGGGGDGGTRGRR